MDLTTMFKDNCGFGLLANIDNVPSHQNLEDAIISLERMMHRGAVAADGKSGDGSGLLLSKPNKFMRKIAKENQVSLPDMYAVGMVFTKDITHIDIIKEQCIKNDIKILLIRDVPINKNALGDQALKVLPNIIQVFMAPNSLMASKRFEALLYLTRKEIEHKLINDESFYIPSFSSSTISYKGLVMPTHIKEFYTDLADDDFEISFALFHQRFSTNTLPQWKLAQPFRAVAHNGEINSVEANRFNIEVKSNNIESTIFSKDEMKRLMPILQEGSSDSASVDNFFEFQIANGLDFFKTARSMVPAPWQNAPHIDSKLRSFYEFSSTFSEAWDGPAAISLTDGRYIGCVLDRNGLRPAKYIVTKDNKLLIASEYGVLDIDEDNIVERGRLQSGEMIGLDLKYGKIIKNHEINEYLKDSQPYTEWLNDKMKYLQEYIERSFYDFSEYENINLHEKQRFYNITHEILDQVIEPMANDGKEAVGSMGDDTPLAAFSDMQRNFSDYFKQKFAQVTNPPIDPYREKLVMSLNTGFGELHNILDEDPKHAVRLKSISPILMKEKMDVLLSFGDEKSPRYNSVFKHQIFSTVFKNDLKKSLDDLSIQVVNAVKDNNIRIIILDDRDLNNTQLTIPMPLVIGRVNQVLLENNIKHLVSIVAISGEVYDPHSASLLIAYGATAIYPYLLFSSIVDLYSKRNLSHNALISKLKNSHKAINSGILKIMSKMGISTVASYRNSALFDIMGLSQEISNDCFSNSHSLLPGLGYEDIEIRLKAYHTSAFSKNERIYPINLGGYYKFIANNEHHDFGPEITKSMQKMADSGKFEDYKSYKELVHKRELKMVRDFFEFNSPNKPIALDEVESKEAIFKRFASAAMSLGSISPEAHEAIAVAMNKIGAQSNSGEGGEDKSRFGTEKNSKIKQVASGRFGVTPEYLVSAEEIQIKVAQGAKPGEGGQLPGHKVTPLIATLRYTIPGVTLISPPPHHDIYSIEDLAQLIFDMKQVNPKAKITIKLVSTAGVGTIAAGVAKAYADKIIISGGDGGTGAAPLSSIKFAGNPWEIGLAEAHNALKVNHLRGSVHLQTDGGLKSGMDVVKAAILGAESYAFGTGVLVLLGCKILRICHTNKCTVGVATQEEELREHFVGTVDRVVNFFTLLADDVRAILASLGYKSLEEIIGKTELLKVIDNDFAKKFDFSAVLMNKEGINTCQKESNDPYDNNEFEQGLVKELSETIQNPQTSLTLNKKITNLNRSFGARISGEIARYYGNKGLEDNTITINLDGIAGQSFGAFLINGVAIKLNGVANDYIGKGMNGGKIVISPKLQGSDFSAGGNTCLYGATGGKLYIAGNVGERFAVRNSGAITVVEGTGDNACEYMTDGVVIILGNTGVNFGAGMTGGVAFIYDTNKDFADKLNRELVESIRIDTDDTDRERHYLKKLLKEYVHETQSQNAQYILDNFRDSIRYFWMVKSKDMKSPLNPDESD